MFPRKKLFALLWPLLVEQLLAVLVGMVDVLMVACVGEAAVSGVSLVDAINQLVIQVLAALATGGAVVCSRFIGMKREDQASFSAGQLIMISTVFSFAIMMLCLCGGRAFLHLIFGSVDADVMSCAAIYFWITALSFPFLAIYNACAAIFRSIGNSKISMLVSLAMNAINVIGNAICIFGLGMGVAGVAVPTLLSRIFAAMYLLLLLRNPGNLICVNSLKSMKPDGQIIKDILSVAIPSGVENGIFQLGKLILQSLVSTLGTASIAGFAVATNLATFLYLPNSALGLGMITIVGQCLGANEVRQARHYTKVLILLDYVLLLILSSVFGFGRHFFIGLYNLSPEAASLAADLIFVHCFAMVLHPPAFLLPNALRAAMDAGFTMTISIFSMWLFRVGGAYFFIRVLGFNVLGVWYAMFIDWVFRLIVFLLRFRSFPHSHKIRKDAGTSNAPA